MDAGGGEKRAALLRRITEEGGFAFVASAEKAAAGDVRAAEAAREMAWEQLHSAPRDEVGAAWRDAYALACLHVAALRAAAAGVGDDERRAALRALDMGLIMGGGLLRAELEDAIARVVADHRGANGGEAEGVAGGNVERWKEGIAGDRDLADVGKHHPCTESKQELITFSQFLERMWSSDSPNLTYVAQHPLLDQVLGRKYFRLYPASVSVDLYPHTETMLSNASQVDLDSIDDKEFPKTGGLEFMDGILEEGDLLYIPPKWWHYVRSLSISFSVSFWWRTSHLPSGSS
nr:unnamed protein product [Digitaria exilis]